MTREEALALLKKYNKEPFHLQHAFTVEGVMRWYANELGHGDEADFWALVGLLHDVDFEQWPEQHCKKRPSCWLRLARTMRSYTRFAATATACAAMWSPCWKWKKCYLPRTS